MLGLSRRIIPPKGVSLEDMMDIAAAGRPKLHHLGERGSVRLPGVQVHRAHRPSGEPDALLGHRGDMGGKPFIDQEEAQFYFEKYRGDMAGVEDGIKRDYFNAMRAERRSWACSGAT